MKDQADRILVRALLYLKLYPWIMMQIGRIVNTWIDNPIELISYKDLDKKFFK